MSILKLPVEKPVTTVMLFMGIALLGLISWSRIPQELFPSMEYPQISIVTKYVGAGPEEAEKLISKVIEESVGTVKNIASVKSTSKEGVSIVTCEFKWGTNMNFASMEVREKIDLIKTAIPREANEPIVLKYNPFQLEAMILSVSYKDNTTPSLWKLAELRHFCKKNIKDEIERLDGIAKVEIRGGEQKEILVQIDNGRLIANQISLLDVVSSIRDANVTYPAGVIKEDMYEYLVKTVGEFKTLDDIAYLSFTKDDQSQPKSQRRVRGESGQSRKKKIIFIRDLAEVKESLKDKTGYSRYNGIENISLGLYPQSGANLIKLSEVVHKKMAELEEKFPKDIAVKIIYDQSEFVKKSLSNIYENAFQGAVLSFILLYDFMRSAVASIIINTAIPVCMLITLSLMYFANISINSMSLGGIVVAFGMVVDAANVVLEQILVNYHKDPTRDQKELIYESTRELFSPIMSSTLTTISIFIPFVFVSGVAGQMFKQMALTITFGMIGSVFVAILLVPRMMLNLDLSKYSVDAGKESIAKYFTPNVIKFLKWPMRKVFFWVAIYASIGLSIFYVIPKEFMPKVDERRFILDISMHPDTPVQITNDVAKKIEAYLQRFKEIENLSVAVGSTGGEGGASEIESLGAFQARLIGKLTYKGMPTTELVAIADKEIRSWKIDGLESEFMTSQGLFGSGVGSSAGLTVEITGKDPMNLREGALKVKKIMSKIPDIYGIKINPSDLVPVLQIEVDRERASLFGLSTQDISALTLAAIKGYVATKLKSNDEELDIRVRMRPEDRANMEKVGEITAFSSWGMTIQLKQISKLEFIKALPSIRRIDGQRTYLVTANIRKNFGAVVETLGKKLKKVKFAEEDMASEITGELLAFRESMSSSMFALLLGIIIIYMILASQFESLLQPVIVMTAVPLGILGAVYTLLLTFQSINTISMLGMIMLTGNSVSISIMLVDRYNAKVEEAKITGAKVNVEHILAHATSEHIRPIAMTTLTTIVDLFPLALGLGEGSAATQSMAIAVVGGLTFTLALALFFVPRLYLLLYTILNKEKAAI